MADTDAFLCTFAALAVIKLMLIVQDWVGPLVSFYRKKPDSGDAQDESEDRRTWAQLSPWLRDFPSHQDA